MSKLQELADRARKMAREHQPQNKGGGDWYRINNADGERAEVFIYGYIGDDWDPDDVTAGGFTRALRDITAPAIDLHINSPGGYVWDGVTIYSALLNHPATVDVSVDGIAASAASFVAMAGDSIAIEMPARVMIHDAAGIVIGDAADMLEMAGLLDEVSNDIAGIYAKRAGGTIESWRDAMRATTWYSSAQAVAAGLADRVNNDNETSAPEDRARKPILAAAGTITNSYVGGTVMTIEEILAAMQAVIDGAEGRSLTDEEVKRYEGLENQLAVERTDAVRKRQRQYESPAPENAQIQAAVAVAPPKEDDGLEKAFDHYLRTGRPNADIADLRVTNAQQVGTDSEGGYLVPDGFRTKLVEVMQAFGGLAAEVDSFSTETGNNLEYPSLDDTANVGGITAEEAPVADGADLAFGTVNLGAFKYTSAGAGTNLPLRVSVELLQDSAFDIAGLVARKLGERIARKQAVDWVTGAGTTLPFGLLHAGLTADVNLAGTTVITYADLLDLEAALDPAYEQNAKWLMNKATWTAVRSVVDLDGRPLLFDSSSAGMGGRPEKTLLGYPVVIDQGAPSNAGDNVKFAALGDLREAYVIRRVSNFALVVDPYTRAVNGQVQYLAWERADGNIQNRSAYVVLATEDVV